MSLAVNSPCCRCRRCPDGQLALLANVSCGKQPLLPPPPMSFTANSPSCCRRRCLLRQTALAAAAANVLAAADSGPHSKPQFRLFGSARTEWGPLGKPPASLENGVDIGTPLLPSRASSRTCSPTLLAPQCQYEAIRVWSYCTQPLLCTRQ
jgi:hypothetical protein